MRVLVVCHGNINRSPLCAAVLRSYPELEVREAAMKSLVAGWRPERAAKKMRDAVMERYGINLEKHRSQPFTDSLFNWADAIVYMDGGNLKRIWDFYEVCHKKDPTIGDPRLIPLGDYCLGGARHKIPDPAFMRRGSEDFNNVVGMIYDATQQLARKLCAEPSARN